MGVNLTFRSPWANSIPCATPWASQLHCAAAADFNSIPWGGTAAHQAWCKDCELAPLSSPDNPVMFPPAHLSGRTRYDQFFPV